MPLPAGGELRVTALPAWHGPVGFEPTTGEVTGFMLHGHSLPTTYVSGDNASLDAVQSIAAAFEHVDIALIFAGAARTSLFDGAPLTLTSQEAAAAAALLGAHTIVPLHIRGWAHFSEGTDDVLTAFDGAGILDRLRLLPPSATAVDLALD